MRREDRGCNEFRRKWWEEVFVEGRREGRVVLKGLWMVGNNLGRVSRLLMVKV